MQIFVQTCSGKRRTLSVQASDTIDQVSGGRDTMQVTVKIISGNTFTLEVEATDTVRSLKADIERVEAIPVDRMRLIFAAKQLEDDRTMAEYNIQNESVLHLVRRNTFPVSVKTLSGKTIALEVMPSDTIEQVMEKIFDKEGIAVAQQRLIYAGRQLTAATTVSEANIQTSSVIHLVVRITPSMDASSSSGVAGSGATSKDMAYTGEPLQRGVVGLQNLGNTCFMNTSLQCLSNIPALREFFVSEEYAKHLNRDAYKTGGKLAEAFAQLLTLMWREDTTRVAPWQFKYQVGQFAEQFSGYGQQDSMELFEYVLDGLKEDCNKVKGKKPYVEVTEANGRDDEEVAAEAFRAYRTRNDSKVDDLFAGLFKSVVRCPQDSERCGRESVTFDPFLTVKLPLVTQAEQRTLHFLVTVIRESGTSIVVNPSVDREHLVKNLIEVAAKEAGVEADRCVLVEIWNKKIHKCFETTQAVENVRSEDGLLLYEVTDPTAFRVSTSAFPSSPDANVYGPALPCAADESPPSDGPNGHAVAYAEMEPPYGVIIYHRQVKVTTNDAFAEGSYTSVNLRGLPMMFSLPRSTTCRGLHAEVARRLHRDDASETELPKLKIVKVDKWNPTEDGTPIDVKSDSTLEPNDAQGFFSVEFEEEAELPALAAMEVPTGCSLAPKVQEQDVEKLLKMFVRGEQLGADDAWYCDRCKERMQAWMKLEFHYAPPVLVLQLKRFRYTRLARERLNNPVRFPLEGLDVAPYCTESVRRKIDDPSHFVYDLIGLSKHKGDLNGGHYVARCRSSVDGEWYSFDDSDVRRLTPAEVESEKVGAYVLVYLRRDHRPESFGQPASPSSPADASASSS
eukprot:TRINITY_DN32970_c0_g1_i1.p1 TRINITY_DN32970_c0_g1~~TRINITY_DN32970_c0_g1_i1.p1  ORF type:complete len:847 (+),score=189.47 TRINITY_DN32970_c0_g1_i1:117-2657(+)